MKKCRYSVNGICTNDGVACEKCNSTEIEMKSCTPFQRCIILHNDNWAVEVKEMDKEVIIAKYNNNELRTDSDVDDFCQEYDYGFDDVLFVIANYIAAQRKNACENCEHIITKYFYGADEPCCRCSRHVVLSDYYKKKE